MERLSQDTLLVITSFLEPTIDQFNFSFCSKLLLQSILPNIKHICLPCSLQKKHSIFGHAASCSHTQNNVLSLKHLNSHQAKQIPSQEQEQEKEKKQEQDEQEQKEQQEKNQIQEQIFTPSIKQVIQESVLAEAQNETQTTLLPTLCAQISFNKQHNKLQQIHLQTNIQKHVPTNHSIHDQSPQRHQVHKLLQNLHNLSSILSLNLSHKCVWECNPTLINSHLQRFSTSVASSSLIHLDLTNCRNLYPNVLFTHGSFPKLQNLILDFCDQIRDEHLQVFNNHPHLTHLSLVSCRIRGQNLHQITHLTHLNLSKCTNISDNTISSLCQLNLVSLCLRDCFQQCLTGVNIDQLLSLEWLDVCGCTQFTDACVRSWQSLTQLRHLDLSGPCQVSDETVLNLLESIGSNLEWLSLEWCVNIGSMTVRRLLSDCLKLEHLNLRGIRVDCESLDWITSECSSVTRRLKSFRACWDDCSSELMCKLVSSMESIEILGLERCRGVDDRVLDALSSCTKLRGLSLYGCDNFSWEGLLKILCWRRVEWLDLRLCMGIPSVGVDEISDWCMELLDLDGFCNESMGVDLMSDLRSLCVVVHNSNKTTRGHLHKIDNHMNMLELRVDPILDGYREDLQPSRCPIKLTKRENPQPTFIRESIDDDQFLIRGATVDMKPKKDCQTNSEDTDISEGGISFKCVSRVRSLLELGFGNKHSRNRAIRKRVGFSKRRILPKDSVLNLEQPNSIQRVRNWMKINKKK